MKIVPCLALLAVLAFSGCISVKTTSEPAVVIPKGTVVTTLPVGYRTRVVKGVTYYSNDNVYYRAHPRGYVVTTRPW